MPIHSNEQTLRFVSIRCFFSYRDGFFYKLRIGGSNLAMDQNDWFKYQAKYAKHVFYLPLRSWRALCEL